MGMLFPANEMASAELRFASLTFARLSGTSVGDYGAGGEKAKSGVRAAYDRKAPLSNAERDEIRPETSLRAEDRFATLPS